MSLHGSSKGSPFLVPYSVRDGGVKKKHTQKHACQKSLNHEFLCIHSFRFNSSLHMLHRLSPPGGNKATPTDRHGTWLKTLYMYSTAKEKHNILLFVILWISSPGIYLFFIPRLCREGKQLEPLCHVVSVGPTPHEPQGNKQSKNITKLLLRELYCMNPNLTCLSGLWRSPPWCQWWSQSLRGNGSWKPSQYPGPQTQSSDGECWSPQPWKLIPCRLNINIQTKWTEVEGCDTSSSETAFSLAPSPPRGAESLNVHVRNKFTGNTLATKFSSVPWN